MLRLFWVFVFFLLIFIIIGVVFSFFVLSMFECVVGRFRFRKVFFLYGFFCGRLFISMWCIFFRWMFLGCIFIWFIFFMWMFLGCIFIGCIFFMWMFMRCIFFCCVFFGEMCLWCKFKVSFCYWVVFFGGLFVRYIFFVFDGFRFRFLWKKRN